MNPIEYVHRQCRHILDERGTLGPQRGSGKAVAEFRATVIAYATDFDDTRVMAATHFTCKKGPVGPAMRAV